MAADAGALLRAPLRAIDELFAQRLTASGCAGAPPVEWGERQAFVDSLGLQDEENFAKIPCMNDVELAESIPPFSLVRYRCLVQDIFEPEIYAAFLEEVNTAAAGAPGSRRVVTSKYRECVEPSPGCTLESLGREAYGQRGACYCVPLPGETEWAQATGNKMFSAVAPEKAQQGSISTPQSVASAGGSTKTKRTRDDMDTDTTAEEPQKLRTDDACCQATAPKPAMGAPSEGAPRTADEFGLNFPLPSEERRGRGASTACIVKLYDADMDALRLCETVEILGILCVNPEMADFDATPLEERGLGSDARQPSSALVPRLHAVLVRRLPFQHPLLPFSPDWLGEARLAAAFQNSFATPGLMASARAAAVEQLRQHLGGDALAAEYLLMLVVARSFGKHGEKSLGAWAMNLMKWPEGQTCRSLCDAAAQLVPRAAHLTVTGPALNSQRWRPRKDFTANRLVAGQLQLAPGTLAVFDETQMSVGEVTAEGVRNLQAITTLVTDQQITCDYSFQDVKVPLELHCLMVSTSKSLVKEVDVVLPLRPAGPIAAEAVSPPAGALDAARLLLGLVTRRPAPLKIPDEVAQKFGEDFAAARQEFNISADLCHTWMSLARAHCLTHAECDLTLARWQTVLQLERERLRRCFEDGVLVPAPTATIA